MVFHTVLGLLLGMSGASNGTVIWSFPTEVMPASPTLYPDAGQPRGAILCAGNAAILVDGRGALRWRTLFAQPIMAPAAVADLEGDGSAEVLISFGDGSVACVDGEGKTRWTTAFGVRADGFCPIVAADVHPSQGLELLVGFSTGWMHCISARGEPLWRFWGDKFRTGAPAVADVDGGGGAEIVYGTDNGNVYCLDGFGDVKWRYSEKAPFGRSAVNLADLEGDGRGEVFITRSNTGNATCLMALDGLTGAFLWRTRDNMQSYCSIAAVDIDGDGRLEILHGDKGNWLYCTNADGTERWRKTFHARGIFWAPAVADVDGDARMDILLCLRGRDTERNAFAFRLTEDDAPPEALPLPGGGNAAPAIGDIDGDGVLDALFATENPAGLQAVRWGGGGLVAWPSLRGDSALTARGNLPAGGPAIAPATLESAPLRVTIAPAFLGVNSIHAAWDHPVPNDAFASVSARNDGDETQIRVTPLAAGAVQAELPFELTAAGSTEIAVRIMASGISEIASGRIKITPEPADAFDRAGVKKAIDAAMAEGTRAGAETRGLSLRHWALLADAEALAAPSAGAARPRAHAEDAEQLRRDAAEMIRFARIAQKQWAEGDTGAFVCWQDKNPWDAFDPLALPDRVEESAPIVIPLFQNEQEDVALNLLNLSGRSIDVRFVFSKPNLNGRPDPDPPLAKHLTLRRGLRVPGYRAGMVLDALPELDLARTITVPPGEVCQLWMVADSHGLEAGLHELTLYAGSLEASMTLREIPIKLEVHPIALPTGVYAQMNWSSVDIEHTSAQALRDMIQHGISVAYGPSLPQVKLDQEGNLTGQVDWTRTDAGLARTPDYFQLLFSGPPPLQWPEGMTPPLESPCYEQGFATAVRTLAAHLKEKGFGYERWAFYPMDEPWLTGFTQIPALRTFCQRVKAIDPKIRIYTDPTGLLRIEYLQEFRDLIDVWQPEINILKRDPELTQWFQDNAKTFWAYEATDPGKNLLPLGYYRGYPWLAWRLGLDGAGFWCYQDFDGYWPLETTQWSVVYPAQDGQVTPSRRWEAARDGQEDYRLMYALREEIRRVAGLGWAKEAQYAQALLDKAVEDIVGWQIGTIDEITRQTREYELDFELLNRYRTELGARILELRILN